MTTLRLLNSGYLFLAGILLPGFLGSDLALGQSPQGFGSGRFVESYSIDLVDNYDSMAISELNLDSYPDMVMISESLNRLIYLESTPDGILEVVSTYDIVDTSAYNEILMIDFNLDGLEECILLSEDGSLLYMQRQGVGFLEVPLTIPGADFFTGFHNADLDGDGFEDLILMTQPGITGGGETYVLTSSGNAELTLSSTIFPTATAVAATDIGSDGDMDLYLAGSEITILENLGGMDFLQLQVVDIPEEAESILVGEVLLDDPDGNYTPDLLLFPTGGYGVYVFPGSLTGTLGSSEYQHGDQIEESSEHVLANLEGSGSDDLIYLNGFETDFQVLRANGEDGIPFGSLDHYDVDPDSTCLTVCDFDLNGTLDVAVNSTTTGRMLVFFGKVPDAEFSRGDVNRDGAINLADPVASLQTLFVAVDPGLCMDAMDCDDNGTLDLSDPILLLNFLFAGGQSLPDPFGFCAEDETDDLLECDINQVSGNCS